MRDTSSRDNPREMETATYQMTLKALKVSASEEPTSSPRCHTVGVPYLALQPALKTPEVCTVAYHPTD